MTLRITYNLFTQRPKQEYDDFAGWAKVVSPGHGDDVYKMNGAGEMLVFSAADFEDESVLTIMGGKVVHGGAEFGGLAPSLPPISPDWAPTGVYGGAYCHAHTAAPGTLTRSALSCGNPLHQHTHNVLGETGRWGIGCTCFAF